MGRRDWESFHVVINRSPSYGLGMAVSGGIDSPDYGGNIVVSDVLACGPADGKLCINDHLVTVNGMSLAHVTHAHAIYHLRNAGSVVELGVRRYQPSPPFSSVQHLYKGGDIHASSVTLPLQLPSRPMRREQPESSMRANKQYPLPSHHHSTATLLGGGTNSGPNYEFDYRSLDRNRPRSRHQSPCRTIPSWMPPQLSNGGAAVAPKHAAPPATLSTPLTSHSSGGGTGQEHVVAPADFWEMQLDKRERWEDLGIELGCQLFVTSVQPNSAAHKDGVKPGDCILSVNGIYSTNLSLIDAQNLLHRPQIRLRIANSRRQLGSSSMPSTNSVQSLSNSPKQLTSSINTSQHNSLFNQSSPGQTSENSKLTQSIRTDLESTPHHSSQNDTSNGDGQSKSLVISEDPVEEREIVFHKDPRLGTGVRLTGGNSSGIFIAGVHPDSAAEEHGIKEGDQLLAINGESTLHRTKEEAVLDLVSVEGLVSVTVAGRYQLYTRIVVSGDAGDDFFVRVNFNYDPPARLQTVGGGGENEMPQIRLARGGVYRVKDSLYGGVVGSWQAMQVYPISGPMGIIPNAHRAEQLTLTNSSLVGNGLSPTVNGLVDYSSSTGTWGGRSSNQNKARGRIHASALGSSLLRRKRSKSHNSELAASTDSLAVLGLPAYERVTQYQPSQPRPLVILGPFSQRARSRLLLDMPHSYEAALPNQGASDRASSPGSGSKLNGAIKISVIKNVMSSGRHCVLDIAPAAVDRLIAKNFAPIVILLRPTSKSHLRELVACERAAGGLNTASITSSQVRQVWHDVELLAGSAWGHIFTDRVMLGTREADWFPQMLDAINRRQDSNVFMSNMSSNPYAMPGSLSDTPSSIGRSLSDPHLLNQARPTSPQPPRPSREQVQPATFTAENYARDPVAQTAVQHPPMTAVHQPSITTTNNYYSGQQEPSVSSSGHFNNNNRTEVATARTNGGGGGECVGWRQMSRPAVGGPTSGPPERLSEEFHQKFGHGPGRREDRCALNDSFGKNGGLNLDRWDGKMGRPDSELKVFSPHEWRQETIAQHRYGTDAGPTTTQIDSDPVTADENNVDFTTSNKLAPAIFLANENASPKLTIEQNLPDQISDNEIVSAHFIHNQSSPPKHSYSQFTANQKAPIHGSADKTTNQKASVHFPNSYLATKTLPTIETSPVTQTISARPSSSQSQEPVNNREIVAEASGYFDHNGGILEVTDSGVALKIPPGALPHASNQHVFIKIYRDCSALSTLDKDRGATLVSPLVMCGPHGLHFLRPVELQLPHYPTAGGEETEVAANKGNDWSFSLLHASSETGKPQRWSELELDNNEVISSVGEGTISVMVDHF